MRDQKKKIAIEIDQNRLLILFEGLVVPLPPPLFKKVGANEEREEREKFGERGASDILKSHVQFYGWARGDKARGEEGETDKLSLLLWDFIGLHSRSRSSASASMFRPDHDNREVLFSYFLGNEFNDIFLLNFSSLLFVERLPAILLASSKTKFWKPILTPRFVKYVPLCRHTRETRKLFLINK